jgi:GT2 family glycosyltransferase/glycosyltransferase involved in cell wall biosynthesis
MRRGQQAAARGDRHAARRWLDRACRLARADDTLALMLATYCLGEDDPRAAELFARVLVANDVREAWLGLALARLRLNEPDAAAAALGSALARHVLDNAADTASIAGRVRHATGAPGWCGITEAGQLRIEPAGKAALVLDGRTLAAARLPRDWRSARWLEVMRDGRHLLGSPIDIAAICRTEGCVATRDGGLEGWAWHPGDPAADPVLTIRALAGGRELTLTARDMDTAVTGTAVLARARRFSVPAALLAKFAGPVAVLGRDGRHLFGSPLDPGAERREAAAASGALARRYPAAHRRAAAAPACVVVPADIVGTRTSPGRAVRRRPVDVVIPAYRGAAETLACIGSVLATLGRGNRVVVVDDASPDAELVDALDRLAARGRIRLIRHPHNRGFPASANAGMRAAEGRDVLLLNSDTLLPPGALERLRDAAYAAPDIGTVTPLSNDATILSYPDPAGDNPVPDATETARLDALASKVNAGWLIDIPTAVGFCMYIRRDCLEQTGVFREDAFAQGYGEENDFSLRARHLGWRHVAAASVFVAHRGGRSFGAARAHLIARNMAVLNRLHPGYDALIAAHVRADPLAEARRRLDLARWRAARKRRAATIFITHEVGGGVERHLRVRCDAARAAGQRPVVLRPARLPDGTPAVRMAEGTETQFPNLRFAIPGELPALARLLAGERPERLELHHLLGHERAVSRLIGMLGVPYDVFIHDAASFCPRVGLVGPERRYCGEPADIASCNACIADAGRNDGSDLPVAELRRVSADLLGAAARVIVPAADTANRIRRHFPGIEPAIVPHEDDAALADPPPSAPPPDGRCRVVVIGAIGIEKGYDVLLACARDAQARGLPLDFVVVGYSIDDARLMDTGQVFVTGEYRAEDATALIRAQRASLALLPSICPETWCFTLTEAWRAGLAAVAFDIGAPAERIRRTGRGTVLPLGLSPPAINNALFTAAGLLRNE